MTDRADVAALVAEILERAGGAGRSRLRTFHAIAESTMDGEVVLVRPAGPEEPEAVEADVETVSTFAEAGTAGTAAEFTTPLEDVVEPDLNSPIEAQVLGDWPSLGQEVVCLDTGTGEVYVIGSARGTPRTGGASYVRGGTANDTTNAAVGTEQAVAALSTDALVVHPRRITKIRVRAIISSTNDGSAGLGRIYRERLDSPDEEGTSGDTTATVLVGDWIRDAFRANPGRLYEATVEDLADPGEYRYFATVQVAGGFTMRYDLVGPPLFAASIEVSDGGAVPDGVAWPDDS